MDTNVARFKADNQNSQTRPTRDEAEAAVETLLAWAGDDPSREGLKDTPARVVRAFEDYFSGYTEDPAEMLSRTFEDVGGYDEMVLLKDIPFESRCEHHLAPFFGVAHIAYLPVGRVVGLSKLARVVDVFAKRLQTQERMTAQIATTIQDVLRPRGVALYVTAEHTCMSSRGVKKSGVSTITTRMLGAFEDADIKQNFLTLIQGE